MLNENVKKEKTGLETESERFDWCFGEAMKFQNFDCWHDTVGRRGCGASGISCAPASDLIMGLQRQYIKLFE